ncbi:MAG: serpin family protein [Patescibacteria group bacterium]|jgi:serpin B
MDPYNILNQNPEQTPDNKTFEFKKILLLFTLLVMVIVAGYLMVKINKVSKSNIVNINTNSAASIINPEQKTLALANDYFGYNLLKALNSQGKNTFISPISISMILDLTSNGAVGDTQKEILNTLGQANFSTSAINKFNSDLMKSYNNNSTINLKIANSIWIDNQISILDSFKTLSQNQYFAKSENLDFNNNSSSDQINKWVSDNTNAKIPEIIDQNALSQMKMVLANAIYFKSDWASPFDEAKTKKQDFNLQDSKIVSVDIMNKSSHFSYLADNQKQVVSLPYANSSNLEMIIFLPSKEEGIDKFINTLDTAEINKNIDQLESKDGVLLMPKFKIEYSKEITNDLKNLGIETAFDKNKADFSNLSKTALFINLVKHKSYLAVDEKGTEATAATIVGMDKALIQNPEKPFEMIIDRPFFVLIRDTKNSLNLFSGIIKDPTN